MVVKPQLVLPPLGQLAQSSLRKLVAEHGSVTHESEELRRCSSRFAYFLFQHAMTQDEHDPTVFAKPFPRHEYIKHIADILQFKRRLAIEKSRQMIMSWVVCAFVLWVGMFRPNVLFFIQSKKEEDAADRLDRIYKLYFRLPAFLRKRFPVNLNSGKPGSQLYTDLYFTWQNEDADFFGLNAVSGQGASIYDLVANKAVRSHLWAIPQGEDVVRQYTLTGIFSDEDAFQELAGKAYGAYMPTLDQFAWVIKVSTANPGHFESVCRDRELK